MDPHTDVDGPRTFWLGFVPDRLHVLSFSGRIEVAPVRERARRECARGCCSLARLVAQIHRVCKTLSPFPTIQTTKGTGYSLGNRRRGVPILDRNLYQYRQSSVC